MSAAEAAVLTASQLEGVAVALDAVGHPTAGSLTADLIEGGRSNLTYRVTDGVNRWVLRTPPTAGRTPSAHDVAREHRLTASLWGSGVPVAQAVLLHADEDLLGRPFTVSAFVEGRAVRTGEELASLDVQQRDRALGSMIGSLVALHSVDHAAVGLMDFGRPDGYASRQVRRWGGQWDHLTSDPEHRALADEVFRGLGRRLPEQPSTAIVHGDYRIDNTLIRDGEVVAVVDWELSTIGDPVADVAMMHAYRHGAFDLIVGTASAWASDLLPAPDRLATMYVDAGGHELANWEFHLALAHFKVATIAAGIEHRRRSGAATGPGHDTAVEAVPVYLDLARSALAHVRPVAGSGRS